MTDELTPARIAFEQAVAESIVADPPSPDPKRIDPRVQAGVRFLDAEYPGWAKKINLRSFDLTSSSQCVLGQVCGDYTDVVDDVWGGNDNKAVEKGFFTTGNDEDWERLEADWRVVIADRKKASHPKGV